MTEHITRFKRLTLYLYRHHLVRYLFVGGTTFAIDLGLLVLLHGKIEMWLPLATAISYSVSIVYNFCLNRWWTFSAAEKKTLGKHIVPYLTLLGCNLVFTVVSVSLLSHAMNYAVAKVISVSIQTTWTYFCYKHFVFN
jgi:putative flippase GtrA